MIIPRRDRGDVDVEALRTLRERAEATLSNLVAATKTHATSSGMSPVSLLDAAASHVSLTVTEIGKTVSVRKATRAEQEQFTPASATATSSNGYVPSLRSVDEAQASHQRIGSNASSQRGESFSAQVSRFGESISSSFRALPGRASTEEQRGPASNMSSSDTNSPPPIFDQPGANGAGGMTSDESAITESPEDAWSELKVNNNILHSRDSA